MVENLMVYCWVDEKQEEKKSVNSLIACNKHAAKLLPFGWKVKFPPQHQSHHSLGCLVCEHGYKKAVKYAETGWYE